MKTGGSKKEELSIDLCMMPKKGLPTALLWNFPVFVVKTLLYNGIGLAQ
jgi:hypothetical protein